MKGQVRKNPSERWHSHPAEHKRQVRRLKESDKAKGTHFLEWR
jgi:hypothetical protein